jgi:hypothetical protein
MNPFLELRHAPLGAEGFYVYLNQTHAALIQTQLTSEIILSVKLRKMSSPRLPQNTYILPTIPKKLLAKKKILKTHVS